MYWASASSRMSHRVRPTAVSTLLRLPPAPSASMPIGGGGVAGNSRRMPRQRVFTLPPPRKRANARTVQPVPSAPSAEWPVAGATTSRARGNCAATRRAFSTGVRRSSSPSINSTGTSGGGPGAKLGAGAAAGQLAQSSIRSLSSAVPRSKGAKALAGTAAAAAAACERRRRGSGGVVPGQGKTVSSHVVVV